MTSGILLTRFFLPSIHVLILPTLGKFNPGCLANSFRAASSIITSLIAALASGCFNIAAKIPLWFAFRLRHFHFTPYSRELNHE